LKQAIALLLCAGCAPPVLTIAGFDSADYVAAVKLDTDGAFVSASEVRPLSGGVDLLSDGETIVLAGWSSADLGGNVSISSVPLTARAGCSPRVPQPRVATSISADGAMATLDPASLPVLSASWAEALCPEIETEALELRLRCRDKRCPWTIGPGSAACTFTVDFGACLEDPLEARIDPDGTPCVATAPSRQAISEDACVATPAMAPAIAHASCPKCEIDLYVAPDAPRFTVERVVVAEVTKFVPMIEPFRLGKVPKQHALTQANDFTVAGDRIVVVTSSIVGDAACGESKLKSYSATTLAPLGSPIVAGFCTLVLAAHGEEVVGVSTDAFNRFNVDVYGADPNVRRSIALDPRAVAGPGEAPLAAPDCSRPYDVVVDGPRAYVVLGQGCGPNVMAVHVVNLETSLAERHVAFAEGNPYRSKIIGDSLWISSATSMTVVRRKLPDLVEVERYFVDPIVASADIAIFDFDFDVARGELVSASIRDQPVLRRNKGPGPFAERTYFLSEEADPTAIWAAPFAGALGLVLGTTDANPLWPTRAALYDRAAFAILPGDVDVGYGPPRRLLADGHGGVLALMGWEAVLVRMRPTAP